MLRAIIPDSLLEGTRGTKRSQGVIILFGSDQKMCNVIVIRAHDTIYKCVIYSYITNRCEVTQFTSRAQRVT